MRVDVTDVGRSESGMTECFVNQLIERMTIAIQPGDMMRFAQDLSPRDFRVDGGAPLLGVKGHVIITHGASCARAICNAVRCAADLADQNVNEHILAHIAKPLEHEVGAEDA